MRRRQYAHVKRKQNSKNFHFSLIHNTHDHRPINSVARLATPTACSGTSAGRHLSRDDSILAARRMQVNGK